MRPLVVRAGDYLDQLADRHGFDADEAWNHPKNEAFRGAHGSPNILTPGAVLHVEPQPPSTLPYASGKTLRFQAHVPTTQILLSLNDGGPFDGTLADQPYEVHGTGRDVKGTTDEKGRLDFEVPVHVRSVRLVFPRIGLQLPIRIGHLDPVGRASGVAQRLKHLAYDERDPLEALRAFQRDHDLEPTGELDASTAERLRSVHGG